MDGSVIVRKRFNFTQIDNDIIRSKKLTFKAKSLLIIFLSLSEDFSCSLKYIAENYAKDGKDAIKAAMKELRENGYVKSERVHNGKQFTGWQHTVYDVSQAEILTAENPPSVKVENPPSGLSTILTAENPPSLNINKNTTIENTKENYIKVFDFYCETFKNYTKPRPLPAWYDMIKNRLKIYSVEDLQKAILVAREDKFLCGEENNSKFYATIEYIFRNDKQIDKLLSKVKIPSQPDSQNINSEFLNMLSQSDFIKYMQSHFKETEITKAIYEIKQANKEVDPVSLKELMRLEVWKWHLKNKKGA